MKGLTAILAAPLVMAGVVAQPQQPVFRTEANLVRRVVKVHDAKGQAVYDLRPEDFEVFEDGVRQQLVVLDAYVGTQRVASLVPAGSGVSSGRGREGVIMPGRAPRDASGRLFIIFVDDLHFQFRDTAQVRAILKLIGDTVIKDTDLVGLVSSGYSSIASDVSYDLGRRRIDDAIKRTMGGGQSAQEIVNAPETAEGPVALRFLAHTAFKTINDLLEKAEVLHPDRRKVFLLISNGYDFNPYEESRLARAQEQYGRPSPDGPPPESPFQRRGQQFAEADLASELAEIIRNARRANVAFFPIDPRGLVAGPDIADPISVTDHATHVRTQMTSLEAMAANTGGRCLCSNNDFAGGLKFIDRETSDYYMLAYQSTNSNRADVVRKVEIRVKRPGVTVSYEAEYTIRK
jgi:VWFA-related protein